MTPQSPLYAGLMPSTIAAVLLAAGAGSRFAGDEHKLLANLPATATEPAATVIERSLAHLVAAGIGPVVLVSGALEIPVPPHLADRVHVHHNDRWADGQITSVRAGIAAATELSCDAVVVGLADQPFITSAAWRAVAAADGPIVVATYGGSRANPVKLDATVWHLLPIEGDEGARALMRVRPELVREVPCTGSPADIDTEEDLRRWQNS